MLLIYFKKVYNSKGKTIIYQFMNNKKIFAKTKSSILLILLTFFLTSFTNNKTSNVSDNLISDFNFVSSSTLLSQEAELGVNITAYSYFGGAQPALPGPNATSLSRNAEEADSSANLINYFWGTGPVAGTGVAERVIVKYSATFTPPVIGTYRFAANADDGTQIHINGISLGTSNWMDKGSGGNVETYTATSTNPVSFVLWFYENGGGAGVSLSWNYNPNTNTLGTSANILTPKTYFTKSAPTSKLTFVAEGLSISPYISNIGSTIPELPNPIKPNYTFLGWFTDSARTNPFTQTIFPSSRETILYAKFFMTNKTITLNQQGGSEGSISANLTFNQPFPSDLDAPIRYGYNFDGYYANTNGSNPKGQIFYDSQMESQTTFTNESLTQIFAHWTAKTFDINLNPTTGSGGSQSINTVVFNQPMPNGLAPTRTGYIFDGYFANNELGLEKRYYQLSTNNTMVSANKWDIDGNPELYAKWLPKQSSLTFNPNGGSLTLNTSKPIIFDSAFGELPTPDFNGYIFLGWTKTINGNDFINEDDIVNFENSTQVFAKWEAKAYDLTFISDNNTHSIRKVIYKSNYGLLPVLEKNGYEFGGWYLESTFNNPITADSINNQFTNHSVFAKWTPVKSNVKFNVESVAGAVIPAPISVDFDSTYGTLPILSKIGYNFNGWFTSLIGGEKISSNTIVSIISEQTLYPQFSSKQFNLFFSKNGGLLAGPESVPILYDQNYTYLPIPTKDGYDFNGWYNLSSNGIEIVTEDKFLLLEDQILYAYWSAKLYNITFDKNDPLASEPEINQVVTSFIGVNFNEKYGQLPVVSKEGYNFNGWFNSPEGGQEITSETINNTVGHHSLFAQFTPRTFNVTYNQNYFGSPSNLVIVNTYDSTYTQMPVVSRNGYDFVGWFTNSSGGNQINANDKVKILSDITYYGRWSIKKSTITFNTNGGNFIAPFTAEYSTPISIVDPIKEGHKFIGWNPNLPNNMPSENSIYEAVWQIENYTFDFFINDGSNALHQKLSADFNSNLTNLFNPNPIRVGYTFNGWSEAVPSIMPDLGEDGSIKQIYANWKTVEYTINYIGMINPSVSNPVVFTVETSEIILDTNFEEPGFDFIGYFENETHTMGPILTIPTGSIGNKILFAKFEKLPYSIIFKDNTGNIISKEEVIFDDLIEESIIPKVEIPGYEFVKWNPDLPLNMPSENIEVQAELKAIKYNFVIKNSLGNIIVDEEVEFEESLLPFTDDPKDVEGYEFVDWSSEIPIKMPAQDLEILAIYEKIPLYKLVILGTQDQVLLEFELMENQAIPTSRLPDFSNSRDFDFKGWDGEIPVVMPGRNITIRPIGTKKFNTISFFSKDQTLLNRFEAQIGTPLDVSSPERIGYTFVGWATSNGDLIEVKEMPIETYDLFATWQPKIYTINVSVASLDYQIDIEFDKPLGNLVNPQLFGFRFDGWKNNLTGEFVNSNTIFTTPSQINLVPVFTRLNAAQTLVSTPGFIIDFILRLLK